MRVWGPQILNDRFKVSVYSTIRRVQDASIILKVISYPKQQTPTSHALHIIAAEQATLVFIKIPAQHDDRSRQVTVAHVSRDD